MVKKNFIEQFVATGVGLIEKEIKITIEEVKNEPGTAGFIFTKLAEAGINVDMIVQGNSRQGKNDISFTVMEEELKKVKEVMEKIKQKLKAEIIYDADISKISLVGAGMRSHPGVAARMFTCLGKGEINIDMISTSEIKISCVIKRKDSRKAARIIHQEFQLDKE